MAKHKIIGGVLMIAGTSIGGGMLGLPIVTAEGGVLDAVLLLVACWALMTFTAFLTLEVNLCFPRNSNVISMIGSTLGRFGTVVGWSVYILFLYALLAAYISGGQDVFRGLLAMVGINLPIWLSAIIFVGVFGTIVMKGVLFVDNFNRVFMTLKLLTLFLLIFFVAFHMQQNNLVGNWMKLAPAVSVAITSFGFSIIVPSLRAYFEDDVKILRKVILLGSLLPLVCYIIWVGVILSTIPLHGPEGLIHIVNSDQPITGLVNSLNDVVRSSQIQVFSRVFTSVCVLTAFLCVSLGLSDYVADGVGREKRGTGFWIVAAVTFLPPLVSVLFFPQAFIYFLSVAGFLCVVLQALVPALMAWTVRYRQKQTMTYQVFGGRLALLIAIVASSAVAIIALVMLAQGK